MVHRSNEGESVHFRSQRVFAVNDQWFFQVRETPNPVGPFPSRDKAEEVLAVFVEDIKSNLTPEQALLHMRLAIDTFAEDDF